MSFIEPTIAAVQSSLAQAFIAQYNLAFQVSPIILRGGIARNATGGMLPIIALYGQSGLLATISDPTAFFATYIQIPGSTLISQTPSTQPSANQYVAANGTIQQPLTVSMHMIAPVTPYNSYVTKLATWTALQGALQAHNVAGGTYSVATPNFIYNNVLLVNVSSLGTPESRQQMIEYQLDFVQPLITQSQVTAAQNKLISMVTSGGQISGVPAWSGNLSAAATSVTGLNAAITQFGGPAYTAAAP